MVYEKKIPVDERYVKFMKKYGLVPYSTTRKVVKKRSYVKRQHLKEKTPNNCSFVVIKNVKIVFD